MIPEHAYTVSQTGCWIWNGPTNNSGYGTYRRDLFQVPYKDSIQLAHRHAWTLTNGPIPDGLYVCHTCDTPPCINPDHLFLGSAADNLRDAQAKGRATPTPDPTKPCKHGHRPEWSRTTQGHLVCLACRRLASVKYYQAKGREKRKDQRKAKRVVVSSGQAPKPRPVGSPAGSDGQGFA